MIGVDHRLAVERDALDRARARAGVDDDVLGGDREWRSAVIRRYPDGGRVEQLAAAHEDWYLVFLVEEVAEALVLIVNDRHGPLEGGVVVEGDVTRHIDPELGSALDIVE